MSLKELIAVMLPAIENELQRIVARLDEPRTRPFQEMLAYHMGWIGEGAGAEAQGKRIRPLVVLLTCAACGSDWQPALPIAIGIELIHNFSLIHDDIQDRSELRRGRPTAWKKWDLPQAINAGDALFILAHLALVESQEKFSPEKTLRVCKIVNEACLSLSSGQFLDISYEKRSDITVEDYWTMITGKTAALLAACTHVGSLLGGADETNQESYRNFGHYLGLAFQVHDDYLGIWGDSALTGKSSESDLVTCKKSLPVLYGLEKEGPFAQRWAEGPIHANEVAGLARQLAEEGAKLYTQQQADRLTDLALQSLRAANPQGEALFELAQALLNRKS